MYSRVETLKEAYHMVKHVEGGFFSEMYTAPFEQGGRPFAGSIYYLLDAGEVCVFHQLDCDEIYYYHEGCGMKITILANGGKQVCLLGGNVEEGERACVMIPKGSIFAAENLKDDGYTLASCMTTPQFAESGCRLIGKDEIRETYPAYYEETAHLAV